MATRIYKVTTTIEAHPSGAGTPNSLARDACHIQLIEAPTVNAAIRHAVKGHVTCEVCSTADAVKLGAQGVAVEVA